MRKSAEILAQEAGGRFQFRTALQYLNGTKNKPFVVGQIAAYSSPNITQGRTKSNTTPDEALSFLGGSTEITKQQHGRESD